MSHLAGRSMACLVVVHDRARWRTEQWCDRPWSSYQSGPIGSVYGRLKKCVRDLSTDRIQAKRICRGVRGCDECGSLCDLWPHVLAPGDASGTQQSHDQTNKRTRRHVEWSRWNSHCRCKKKNGCQPWGGKKMLWYCMLYPKWNWWTQPKRQLWPPLPLTFLWPKSLGSLSKHWLGGTTWEPIYNSPSATSPTRTRQNLPTPRCDQPIIGMENIMWGFNPSIWRWAWWISYSKWKITDCNCRSKWNGVLTTSMPPSKRSWVSGNVWR